MPQLTYPSAKNFYPSRHEFDLTNTSVRFLTSPFTGSTQTQETPWPRWRCTLGYAGGAFQYKSQSAANTSTTRIAELRAFWSQARGMAGRVLLFNHERQVPLGTLRGALTLQVAAAVGDVVLSINAAGQNGATLKKGDMIGLSNNQLFRCVSDSSVAAGVITAQVEPPVKVAQGSGSAVSWERPTALFRVMDNGFSVPLTPGQYGDSNIELLEL